MKQNGNIKHVLHQICLYISVYHAKYVLYISTRVILLGKLCMIIIMCVSNCPKIL